MINKLDLTVDMVIQTITLWGPDIWEKSDKDESLDITLQVPKGIKAFLNEFIEITSEEVLGTSRENFKNIIFKALVLRGLTYSALGEGKVSKIMDKICSEALLPQEVQNPLFEVLDKISTDELKSKENIT